MDISQLLIDIIIAYALDLIIGDPYWLPHPVRFIGNLIKGCENILRSAIKSIPGVDQGKKEKAAGLILMVTVVATSFFTVLAIQTVASLINPFVFHMVNIYFIYSALATKCLAVEALKVHDELANDDLHCAREKLSMLVGRDTRNLDEGEVIRGVVETTAENTVDGIISPIAFAVIGTFFGVGAPLVYAFKGISTLDSMVGYMNDKYKDMGYFSAKIDDVANYIPARLSGLLIPLGALICRMDFKNSFKIMLRDRKNHKSPNCGYPEAAVAGALNVRIGGTNSYFGKVMEKPTIGDMDREIENADIKRTVKLMYVTSALSISMGLAVIMVISSLK